MSLFTSTIVAAGMILEKASPSADRLPMIDVREVHPSMHDIRHARPDLLESLFDGRERCGCLCARIPDTGNRAVRLGRGCARDTHVVADANGARPTYVSQPRTTVVDSAARLERTDAGASALRLCATSYRHPIIPGDSPSEPSSSKTACPYRYSVRSYARTVTTVDSRGRKGTTFWGRLTHRPRALEITGRRSRWMLKKTRTFEALSQH